MATRDNLVASADNNTVGGRPIVFLVGYVGGTYDISSYGQVVAVSCVSFDLIGGMFHNAAFGVLMALCNDSQVLDSTFDSSERGSRCTRPLTVP